MNSGLRRAAIRRRRTRARTQLSPARWWRPEPSCQGGSAHRADQSGTSQHAFPSSAGPVEQALIRQLHRPALRPGGGQNHLPRRLARMVCIRRAVVGTRHTVLCAPWQTKATRPHRPGSRCGLADFWERRTRRPWWDWADASVLRACRRRASAPSGGNAGGGEVGPGAVPARRTAPPAGGITGAIDADFHHRLEFHQHDVQLFPAAPPGAERPCPSTDARAVPHRAGRRPQRLPGGRGSWCRRRSPHSSRGPCISPTPCIFSEVTPHLTPTRGTTHHAVAEHLYIAFNQPHSTHPAAGPSRAAVAEGQEEPRQVRPGRPRRPRTAPHHQEAAPGRDQGRQGPQGLRLLQDRPGARPVPGHGPAQRNQPR